MNLISSHFNIINNQRAICPKKRLKCSVLVSVLFLLYTAELLQLIESHGLHPHLCADDTQVYEFCAPNELQLLQMSQHISIMLLSEFVQSAPVEFSEDRSSQGNNSHCLHELPQSLLRVGTDLVLPTAIVRNLGIFIDADVSMRSHVIRTVSSCFTILRQLCCIRRSVPRTVFQSLMSSLVLSWLDYGNATLFGHLVPRLQSVMNAAFKSHVTVPASAELVESS